MEFKVYSPRGRKDRAAYRCGGRTAWQSLDGNVLRLIAPDDGVFTLEYYAEDEKGYRSESHLYSARIRPKAVELHEHNSSVRDLAFSPDGELLATAGKSGLIRLWDWAHRVEVDSPLRTEEEIYCLALSADKQRLAYGTKQGEVWGYWRPKRRKVWLGSFDTPIWSIAFSPNDRHVVAGGGDGKVGIYQINPVRELYQFHPHRSAVSSLVAFEHQGTTVLASGSEDGNVRVWNLNNWQECYAFGERGRSPRCLAIMPNKNWILAGGMDGSLTVWDWKERKAVRRLPGHPVGLVKLAISSDGVLVFSIAYDGKVRIWDVPRGRQLQSLQFGPEIVSAAINADTGFIAFADRGGRVRVCYADPLP